MRRGRGLFLAALTAGFWTLACASEAPPAAPDPAPAAEPARTPPPDGSGGGGKRRGRSGGGGGDGGPEVPVGAAPAEPCASWTAPEGRHLVEVPFAGSTYRVNALVPAGSSGPRPLVVLLHGGGGDAPTILRQSALEPVARERGWVLAVPEAMDVPEHGPRWNAGKWAEAEIRDDVGFLDAVVKAFQAHACVDPDRVIAAGFSNGGQMALRWACQSDVPDALVTAAGTLRVEPSSCTARPVPYLQYVGTADPVYASAGKQGGDGASAVQTVEHWRSKNAANDAGAPQARDEARCTTWTGKAPVTLCEIEGYGHAWPGPQAKQPTKVDLTAHLVEWLPR